MTARFLLSFFISFVLAFTLLTCSTLNPRIPQRTILDVDELDEGQTIVFSLDVDLPEEDPKKILPFRAGKQVLSGLDVLAWDDFKILRGKSFALLTNQTGLDRNLQKGFEVMLSAGVRPTIVFEPEHGLFGYEEGERANQIRRDSRTGLTIFSLYSLTKRPDPQYLRGLDYIVIDIHNLPVRAYTYATTMTYLMEIANEEGIEVLVLDRPNPYALYAPQGPYPDQRYRDFVSYAPVPFLYCLTPGEYARYMQKAKFENLKLSIVTVSGYTRSDLSASVRSSWVNPSPNIPSWEAALVYPGLVFFEGTNISLGRGTTRPFVTSGAPFVEAKFILDEIRQLKLPGVQFAETHFTPSASIHAGAVCHGIMILPLSQNFDPIRTGYEYMRLMKRYNPQFQFLFRRNRYFIDVLWGGPTYRKSIEMDLPYEQFKKTWERDSTQFAKDIEPLLLYPHD